MKEDNIYQSPDGKIKKEIIEFGTWGNKPTENCECKVSISDLSVDFLDIDKFNNAPVCIGDIDTAFGRLLDKCLQTMMIGELAKVTFTLDKTVTFKLELIDINPCELIFEWDTRKKYDCALYHKEQGVKLFGSSYTDASHHFSKGKNFRNTFKLEYNINTVFSY